MTSIRLCALIFAICNCFIGITGFSKAVDNTTLRLYFRNDSYIVVKAKNAVELVPHMNLTETTLIHCHGYTQSADTDLNEDLIKAFLKGFKNYNIIAIDYRNVSMKSYVSAFVMVGEVAEVVANSITDLRNAGVSEKLFIITGVSLGGELAGFIGRKLNFTVPKIIAMDPAGPLFDFNNDTISASDAACVQCIHTDAGFYGTANACGHIDFYPNGGTREQPGCKLFSLSDITNTCSHSRSEIYMIESVINPYGFLGVKCHGYDDFKAGRCRNSIVIPMGNAAPCNVTGKFYLQTNSSYPYALGKRGTKYHPN